MTRTEWVLQMSYAEHDLEMAEADLHDHDGSQLDAPERIRKAKDRLIELMCAKIDP